MKYFSSLCCALKGTLLVFFLPQRRRVRRRCALAGVGGYSSTPVSEADPCQGYGLGPGG